MPPRNKFVFPIGVLAVLTFAACSDNAVTRPSAAPRELSPQAPRMSADIAEGSIATPADLVAVMDAVNASLVSAGVNYRVAIAEYVTSGDGGEAGGTVLATNIGNFAPFDSVLAKDVGNKALSSDFVPFDARRSWSGIASGPNDNITYAIDRSVNASGTRDAVPPFPIVGQLTAAQTDAAIVRAMGSWEAENCSQLGLTRNNDFGLDIGVVAFLNRLGGSPFILADIQHAGWRDINFAGGILAVTFTFVFGQNVGTPPVFVPSDIDNNGKTDVAFREIYYDPSWNWRDNGVDDIDVETVALHEIGHGLSQAHFGTIGLKDADDFTTLKAAPRAVMNALYSGPFRSLVGTDNGGHCANWAAWPNM